MSSSVELRGIDKFYQSGREEPTQVLFDVSFEAKSGEFVVLLGPSGCGKSTSLRLIAGLEDAQNGQILIDGQVVNDVPASRRKLAMVFQNYALFPHLSIAENIMFGLKVRRVEKSERRRRLEQTAELLELTPYLDRRPAQLSGGQRQRVALGRALVSGASLILMDEPLSNLDAKLRQQMRVDLRQLQRDLGLTVVYVTHDQVEAMTMADRVVVMRGGQVDQIDPPRTLFQRPTRASVARFIGSPPMNLLEAEVADGHVATDAGVIRVPLPAGVTELPARVLLGVRPEDITLEAGDHQFETTLKTVELLGADQLARFDVGGPAPLIARLHANYPLDDGARYRIGFRLQDLHLFDAESGQRVPGWDAATGATTSENRQFMKG
ncbi:ABC transporter ATP-binding protein [Phytoactinopolyspora mesophila]|uniref:ATP-binding cassette domain-containing protein n=1 Tax=Phytoactinopolyspora mesophila TaxID=2650750 RepID=A0A7K3M6V1_9ACTN|nr:ABC transporter ATP-binding protein [Phytoactinopolyspora mesophila]NDL59043.1 ATP-binding cassette domain-containing protein [Phytoactinopolyspora mesophila]